VALIGYALIAIAAGWLLYKVYVSYTSAGGTDFAMPVYDAALYPPILGTAGLYLVMWGAEDAWSIWIYLAIWLVATLLSAGLIRLMEELGDKPL
jgi:hypothetical protein